MRNFTVGPVQSSGIVKKIGAENTPYFRTPEFSKIMLENEKWMCRFSNAPENSRAVFITGSGTASMEAAVINLLDQNDKAVVVKGGSFGERFVQICEIHHIPHTVIDIAPGNVLQASDLQSLDVTGHTAFLVNLGETSTGVLYDIDLIADFCKEHGLFLIVDAISAFLADEINMNEKHIGALLTGSQKALAVPPGISVIVLSPEALSRVERIDCGCLYLNLKLALENGERGQTPFTPAVTTLIQIHERLKEIDEAGGPTSEQKRIAALAEDFRKKVSKFPFSRFAKRESNAVTALQTSGAVAKQIFQVLKDEYDIWVCPNGGELGETVFRVGHIGDLTAEDNDALIAALEDMQKRGMF